MNEYADNGSKNIRDLLKMIDNFSKEFKTVTSTIHQVKDYAKTFVILLLLFKQLLNKQNYSH